MVSQIDGIFEQWTFPGTPGGTVAIVKDGKVIFLKGYGCADVEMSVPMTSKTRIHLASLSKQFTGYCIAKLILEGRLSLDTDIREHVPEMQVFPDPIKVRDLVYQKSGLRDFLGLLPLTGFHINSHLTSQDALDVLYNQKELNFRTGERWQYCNSNYFLLAEIVKRVTGESIREWAEKNVFAPLGMTDTLYVDSIGSIVPGRARSYHQSKEGSFSNDPFLDVTVGHSGVYSTAEDMAKWIVHLHDLSKRDDPLINLMLQDDVLSNGGSLDFYSFGLFKSSNRALQYWHRGSFFGFKSVLNYYPGQGFGLVIMGNVQTFDRRRYAREITRLFHPELARPRGAAISRSLPDAPTGSRRCNVRTEALEDYTGHYVVDRMTIYMISNQGKSLAVSEVGDSRTTSLIPVSKHEFRNRDNSMSITFSRNSEGRIERLTLRTTSGEVTGARARELTSSRKADYIGEYYSEELEISIKIMKANGRLVARNLRLGDVEIYSSCEDGFRCGHDFFSHISFYRDEDKQVGGFLMDGFFVSNLRFMKQR